MPVMARRAVRYLDREGRPIRVGDRVRGCHKGRPWTEATGTVHRLFRTGRLGVKAVELREDDTMNFRYFRPRHCSVLDGPAPVRKRRRARRRK